jgi:hypothetical protein
VVTDVIHVMLDLETWGTEPGCDLRSIGACVFDPLTGEVAGADGQCGVISGVDTTFYLATDNPRGYHGTGASRDRFFITDKPNNRREYALTRDPKTEQWWSEQSEAAQGAFEKPVQLFTALHMFTEWLVKVCPDQTNLRLWAHGPVFDVSILAAVYKVVGLPVPWHYRAPRDTRTAFDMAGIDDHSAWLAQHPGPLGIPHHALDDAICQARAVCGAYQRLRAHA